MKSVLIRGGQLISNDPKIGTGSFDVRIEGERIAEVGKLRRRSGEEVIDARGCAVLPGFVQAHVHLCQVMFRGMADDLALLPWLAQRIWPLEAAHSAASLRASAELGLAEMIASGTTSILDMGTTRHHDEVFAAMERSGIRGFSGKTMMDRGENALLETTEGSLEESCRLADRWHGAADGRLHYAFAPRFILSCTEELIRKTALASKERPGTLVHTHAAEHADERKAVKEMLGEEDIRLLEKWGVSGPNAILAHGVQLRAAERKRLSRLGTRIIHCPSANLKLASGIADVPKMLEAGIVVGLGADGAPCNNRLDPFTELRSAALLAKSRGDATALPAAQALHVATRGGAEALGYSDVGVLAPGWRADLQVVRIDQLHHLPGGSPESRIVYASLPSDVEHVFANGKQLLRSGELTTLDPSKIVRNVMRESKKLLARVGPEFS